MRTAHLKVVKHRSAYSGTDYRLYRGLRLLATIRKSPWGKNRWYINYPNEYARRDTYYPTYQVAVAAAKRRAYRTPTRGKVEKLPEWRVRHSNDGNAWGVRIGPHTWVAKTFPTRAAAERAAKVYG